MIASVHRRPQRSGAAAVEMSIVMITVLVPMMLGLWEMGRVVQIQQILSNATRSGARLAAQATTISSTGNVTQITVAVAPPNTTYAPNVKAAVAQYMSGAGLTTLVWSDFDVTFAFLDGNTALTQPYQGSQNQRFQVTVTITDLTTSGTTKTSPPLAGKLLWTTLGLVKPKTLSYTADWRLLIDNPFVVNSSLPGW